MSAVRAALEASDVPLSEWLHETLGYTAFYSETEVSVALATARTVSPRTRPRVRVSHQPNLWGYRRLFHMLDALARLDRNLYEPIYYAIDYDTVAAPRFARPLVWLGGQPVHAGLSRKLASSSAVVALSPAPHPDVIHSTFALAARSASEVRLQIPVAVPPPDLSGLEDCHQSLAHGSASLGEFASRSVLTALELSGVCPPAMVVGSDLFFEPSRDLITRVLSLLELWPDYVEATRSGTKDLEALGYPTDPSFRVPGADVLPFWWICECGRRVRVASQSTLSIEGQCGACGTAIVADLLETLHASRRWIPRIGLQHMLSATHFDYDLGFTYGGSVEHTVAYSIGLRKVGITAFPHVVYSGRGSGTSLLAHPAPQVRDGFLSHLVY